MKSMINHEKKNKIVAYILLLLTALIWGGTWPLGRWMVSEEVGGETIPPLMIAVIRYALAIICFLIILKYREGRLNTAFALKNWKYLVFMGFTSVTIYQTGYLVGEIFTSASDASILVTTNAVWVVILSGIFLETEKITAKKLFGTILAFTAVIMVIGFSPNLNVPNRILGDMLILMAAFAYATYTTTTRYFMNKTKKQKDSYQPSSLWLITWISLFGFLITTPIALIVSPEYLNPLQFLQVPNNIWIGSLYLSFISTVGAYTFYLEGVKRLDASRAAIFQTLVPLIGIIFSAIFLGEQFDIFVYPVALICVAAGIILVNYKFSQNEKIDESGINKE